MLIDREIIIDTVNQSFLKGESFTELSIQLWDLICQCDISEPKKDELEPIPEKLEDLKELDNISQITTSIADNYFTPFESYLPDRRLKK